MPKSDVSSSSSSQLTSALDTDNGPDSTISISNIPRQSRNKIRKPEKTTSTIEKPKKKKSKETEEDIVDDIIEKAFDVTIGKSQYSQLKTVDWISRIIQNVSKALLKRNEKRKFIVHCIISSKTKDLSICSANMCSWNTSKDVVYYTEWTSKTVFGSAYVFFITHRFSD
ncbi:unnamed protein product [Caenorhabditis sp. 36 PRJEB53466]|nr:unnamed protein product [Caenorhabditis sp. 36 PRJEB53466]